jgi:hypothetical protein
MLPADYRLKENTMYKSALIAGCMIATGILPLLGQTSTSSRDYRLLATNKTSPIFSNSDRSAELIVTIYGKEGRVDWSIPASIREKTAKVMRK